jgi:hypothetical protein
MDAREKRKKIQKEKKVSESPSFKKKGKRERKQFLKKLIN